jgi:hypothetical protein
MRWDAQGTVLCLGGCQSPQNRGIKTSSSIFHQFMCRHLRRSTLRTSYHRFLVNDVPVLLEHVFRQHVWFMLMKNHHIFCVHSDSAPLDRTQRFRGWPGWSPDLNHMDSWLWVHLRALVYPSLISYLEVLEKRVGNIFREIQVKP